MVDSQSGVGRKVTLIHKLELPYEKEKCCIFTRMSQMAAVNNATTLRTKSTKNM